MKEKYLRPAIINSGTLGSNGVLPILEGIVAAVGAGFALGKSLKSMIGVVTPCEKFLTLTARKN